VTYNTYRRNFISRLIFRNVADIYIALSKFIANFLVNLGIPKTKIRILPNGIDVERFRPRKESKIQNLLLFVGRLEEKKGLPVLLRCLSLLKTSVHLAIIGLPLNPEYYEKILAFIEKVNNKSIHKVTYMGALDKEKLLEWYQKASIFICPSTSESFPMVNLEALSCGTPVVASNVGAISEVVRNHENGILVPPNDVAKLAEAIPYLLDNEEIIQQFGDKGRKWIVENFSTDVIVEKLYQIYKGMIR